MTDYKMTDEKRKKLTEKLLGECWHEWGLIGSGNHKCKHCGYISFRDFFPSKRTFTTDADMLAVFRKIRDAGKWDEFYWWSVKYFAESKECIGGGTSSFMLWLLDNPERACCLAAMFLEGQG